jgi:hypothetical protein
MKNFDFKHIAFHVLTALYFIWLPVFGILLYMALNNTNVTGNGSSGVANLLLLWVFLNLITGTAVFTVIQLFKSKNLVARFIFYSYFVMVAACVTTVFIVLE